jgi:hypothetical protein
MGDRRSVYRILVGKTEGKRPPGISRCRGEDNVNIDLQEVKEWSRSSSFIIGSGGRHL